MKIKRFFAPDMRQAIRMVRDEQGPDAVIISTRTTGDGVEIVAAVDYDAELVHGVFSEARDERPAEPATPAPVETAAPEPVAPPAKTRAARLADKPPPEAAAAEASDLLRRTRLSREPRIEWGQDPALTAMQEELKALRMILQDQVTRLATADYDRREPVRADIVRRLLKAGFDEAVARGIAAATTSMATPEEAWREAMFGLATRLPMASGDPLEQSNVIALIGATGVGKTTTAAKLATRACLRYGSKSVALISTDDFRVGAQRQLASFGLLLGVPVRQARSNAELVDHLAEFGNRRLVIVDTAGMGQRDLRLIDETRKLAQVADLQSYLVMSANVQREVMDEVMDAFGREHLAGCILTKLDESARLGPALSTVLTHQLPVAFISEGQRVPEDLRPARASDLVSRALAPPARPAQIRQASPAAGLSREVRHESA
jgi:flagellar biosynthesis protein FlhF